MTRESAAAPTASVIIITYKRPSYVRTCLRHLAAQTVPPLETIVVDGSPDDETYTLLGAEFPDVIYVRNPYGAGTMATSRDIGTRTATGDIVAFIDDDAYPRPDWLGKLVEPYSDPTIGGVGGRACNGIPGEENAGAGQIGMLLPNGTLTGNFGADPGRLIEVDHMIGANHSFRRKAIQAIDGIHDLYPGTCLREETDTALRMKAAGWRLVFNPAACVDHVAGPYAKGKRFDLRYTYYSHRNHIVLLSRTLGVGDPHFRRYLLASSSEAAHLGVSAVKRLANLRGEGWRVAGRSAGGKVARAATIGVGLAAGLQAAALKRTPVGR